jgi:hypothetical protein
MGGRKVRCKVITLGKVNIIDYVGVELVKKVG